MSDEVTVSKPHSRRAVVKGAAWSVPVIAAAVAAPAAVASVNDLTLAFTASSTSLLSLNLLDGGGTLTATALVTVPTQVSVSNGPGAVTGETATVTVAVGRPAGINLPVGRARGFGVASFNGTATTAGQRTATYQSAPIIGQYGFPATTWTGTTTVTVASNGTLNVPIVWGLAGISTGVSISALASFPVTITVVVAGRTLTATSTISVPVGAGIL
ncbi:hypothetical protein ACIPWF_17270 [Paenarthrobacter sp. NPDC089989]|uniref:hypothetical protein n=1 Tax=unclassified Paenarthrobacter TaxID=2634190 RepID=UPI003808BC4F